MIAMNLPEAEVMQTNEELSKLKSQVLKARETETHMAQQMIKVEAQVTEKSKKSNRQRSQPTPSHYAMRQCVECYLLRAVLH